MGTVFLLLEVPLPRKRPRGTALDLIIGFLLWKHAKDLKFVTSLPKYRAPNVGGGTCTPSVLNKELNRYVGFENPTNGEHRNVCTPQLST